LRFPRREVHCDGGPLRVHGSSHVPQRQPFARAPAE
jgi:hypothetical protein